MRRLLGIFATLLSLGLCAASAFLWFRSRSTTDFVGHGSPVRWYGALSMNGLIRFERGDYESTMAGWTRESRPATDRQGLSSEVEQPDTRRFGPIGYRRIIYDTTRERRSLYVPHWVFVVLAGVLPLARVYRMLRPRHAPGHCRKCGYDLRASSDRCPECGAEITPAGTPASTASSPPGP